MRKLLSFTACAIAAYMVMSCPASAQDRPPAKSAPLNEQQKKEKSPDKAEAERRAKLRAIYNAALKINEQAFLMEEPVLRLEVGLKLSDLLLSVLKSNENGGKKDSGKPALDAQAVVRDAIDNNELKDATKSILVQMLVDIQENKSKIPKALTAHYHRTITARLHLSFQDEADAIIDRYINTESYRLSPLDQSLSLLNSGEEKGIEKAAELAGRSLNRMDPESARKLVFILSEMRRKAPQHLAKLLKDLLIARKQQPGSMSLADFILLRSFYLTQEAPQELVEMYVAMFLDEIRQNVDRLDRGTSWLAYQELTFLTGIIQNKFPLLMPIAKTLTEQLKTKIPENASLAARQSPDPLAHIKEEAKKSGRDEEKSDLMRMGIRQAITDGKLDDAIDLVEERRKIDRGYASFSDQDLAEIVEKAIGSQGWSIARRSYSRISDLKKRAGSMIKVAAALKKKNEHMRSAEVVEEVFQTIATIPDPMTKADALFDLEGSLSQMDSAQSGRAIREAVFIANEIKRLATRERPGQKESSAQLDLLLGLAQSLYRGFKGYSMLNPIDAESLAEKLMFRDFSLYAKAACNDGALKSLQR